MLNRVVMIGRLANDPELRYTQTSKAVCSFSLAVDGGFGENKHTDFFDIVVWGKAGESCANYLSKGKLAAIDGQIKTRFYETQDGKKIKVYEIVADNVRFLSPKNEAPASPANIPDEGGLPY